MPDQPVRKQASRRSRNVFCLALVLFAALPLAACGKKPGEVDPPPGAENIVYPKIYPDPATDPKPAAE